MTPTVSTPPILRGAGGRSHRLAAALAAALVLGLTLALSLAALARADVGTTIIERCTHGQSLSGFSEQDYRDALRELPTEVEEYSDCANLIRQAQLAAAGGGGGPAGGGGAPTPIPLTAAQRTGLRHAAAAGAQPVQVGNQIVRPGVVPVNISSALSSLPTPLLATLAFLLVGLVLVAGGTIRDRVRARRSR